ncbi:S-adenosylmethionine decarboxylase [Macleaya cordata]|uniref:S-adenosylmethionine decarboxylase proenzyme n=1 Tax=Macleaya cordata TaxID=56857 RepID=A0A200RBL3_MACCD|nr:S-adenosylmethionine decarboxylase [Macleaya cordata]
MAVSGFEGFEKRLELQFSGDDPTTINIGLRRLDFELLEEILDAVQCTVVSAVGNRYFDAYVLSESSLFVYPTKIIIKTCGTTQLLKSVPLLLSRAMEMGLTVCGCRYTRGNFIFPKAQPFPHTSFREEIIYLENNLPENLCYRKASVMPSKKISKKSSSSHSWHVYSASDGHDHDNMMVMHHDDDGHDDDGVFTIEVCMTELDRALARKFFRRPGDGNCGEVAGKEMTEITGIRNINSSALICDFGFDPCGYSMNGIDGANYSTIHVTPEDGYSYASFECVGSCSNEYDTIGDVMKKVVQVFRPATMSISITSGATSQELLWKRVSDAVESLGLNCSSCTFDEFPGVGTVVFQTFTTSRRK